MCDMCDSGAVSGGIRVFDLCDSAVPCVICVFVYLRTLHLNSFSYYFFIFCKNHFIYYINMLGIYGNLEDYSSFKKYNFLLSPHINVYVHPHMTTNG